MPFPITCSSCGKTFSIADDVYERKVKGRVVTIKCKQCQAGIRIDDTQGGAHANDAEPLSVAQPEPPPGPAATPVAGATPPVEPRKAEPEPKPEAPKAQPEPAAAASKVQPVPTAPATKAQPAVAGAAPKATATVATAVPKAQPGAAAHKAELAATARTSPGAVATAAKAPPAPLAPRSPTLLGITAPKAQPVGDAPKAQPVAAAPRAQPVVTGAPRAQPVAAARAQATAATPKAPATATSVATATTTPKVEPVKAEPKPAAAARAEPTALDAVAAAEILWAVDYPDGQDRELTATQVKRELTAGVINETTLVWREGMEEWKELGQVPELSAPPPAAAPKPPAPGPAAQRDRSPSAPILEPAVQLPRAPSSPGLLDPGAHRPRAPSAPFIPEPAHRPRAPSAPFISEPAAHRPRAPVAAALPAPAPFPKAAAPFSPFDTSFDAPMPTPPAFAAASAPIIGLTPPAFTAAPIPAPLPLGASALGGPRAPLPFAPQPPLPSAAVAQVGGLDEWPRAKSRAPLVIGVIVALLALGGAIFFLASSSDTRVPPAPISALPAPTPTSASTHPSAEPTATGETSPAPNTAATGDQARPHSALDQPGAGPLATPNAGFAELFASGARHADEAHGVNGPTQRFDANAAKAALAGAAAQTGACREKGGPAGKATIVVTFEPSGKVSSATVSDAPFAGTSSGACIAAAMKRATVPAFSGLPGTVTKTINIQ